MSEKDPCPACGETDKIRWVESTTTTDSWDCRECGWTWVIQVALAEETIRN